jgi:hypothetical protein
VFAFAGLPNLVWHLVWNGTKKKEILGRVLVEKNEKEKEDPVLGRVLWSALLFKRKETIMLNCGRPASRCVVSWCPFIIPTTQISNTPVRYSGGHLD